MKEACLCNKKWLDALSSMSSCGLNLSFYNEFGGQDLLMSYVKCAEDFMNRAQEAQKENATEECRTADVVRDYVSLKRDFYRYRREGFNPALADYYAFFEDSLSAFYGQFLKVEEQSQDSGQAEPMTDEEIDAVLAGSDSEEASDQNPKQEKAPQEVHIYDFKRPDIFTRSELQELQGFFEDVLQPFCTTLASYRPKEWLDIRLASVDQLTVDEYYRAYEKEPFFYTASVAGSPCVMHIDWQIVYEYLFGRKIDDEGKLPEIEALEADIAGEKIVRPFFDALVKAMQSLGLENEMSVVDYLHSKVKKDVSEMGLLLSLVPEYSKEFRLIDVFLPEGLAKALLSVVEKRTGGPALDVGYSDGNSFVSLGNFEWEAGADIKEGSVIQLSRLTDSPVDVIKDGKVSAKGKVVVVDGEWFGVRITQLLDGTDKAHVTEESEA